MKRATAAIAGSLAAVLPFVFIARGYGFGHKGEALVFAAFVVGGGVSLVEDALGLLGTKAHDG